MSRIVSFSTEVPSPTGTSVRPAGFAIKSPAGRFPVAWFASIQEHAFKSVARSFPFRCQRASGRRRATEFFVNGQVFGPYATQGYALRAVVRAIGAGSERACRVLAETSGATFGSMAMS